MTHDLGILLADNLALAAHRGEKTQTRRPIIHRGEPLTTLRRVALSSTGWDDGHGYDVRPMIAGAGLAEVGGRVWVREAWRERAYGGAGLWDRLAYRADVPVIEQFRARWRPSIHMPKWAARTWGRITEVRPERVQDITLDDVVREGINTLVKFGQPDAQDGTVGEVCIARFRRAWDACYAHKGLGWDANPWVWSVSWEPIPRPEVSP